MEDFSVERAIQIAAGAHSGQKRWNGSPYILHPLRVMAQMSTDDERIVAVLHDVIEDTTITCHDLIHWKCPGNLTEAVVAISKPKKVFVTNLERDSAYLQYLITVKNNPISRVVKIADILDNLNLGDLSTPVKDRDLKRIGKYIEALKFLRNQ